jgi:hypothetical protein
MESASPVVFALYAMSGAFITYFSMYAFRKPFSAATFDEMALFGIDYKVVAIITQVCGYALSKFVGIKVISEMRPETRVKAILLLIGVAWIALFLFGSVPYPYNVAFLFLNGLPLGMIWGVVFSFLEGRRFTELLGAGLCASFIVSSGFVKAVGRSLVYNLGVSEFWMPFLTGLIFVIPLFIGVFMLSTIPRQSEEDESERTRRVPMDGTDRIRFFSTFSIGIVLTTAVYMLLTVFRDIRDNFTVEIWRALGYGDTPHILATAEIPVAVLVLVFIGLMSFVKSNRTAFYLNFHIIIFAGAFMLGSTIIFNSGAMNPVIWMILNGFSMYLAYIAYHTFLYERWIALFRYKSNIGFLMYIADAFGYLAAISVMLVKNFMTTDPNWYKLLLILAYLVGGGTMAIGFICWGYFKLKEHQLLNPRKKGNTLNG